MNDQLDVMISVGNVFTPCEFSSQLIKDIKSYELPRIIRITYVIKLRVFCRLVEKGRMRLAINRLNAFMNLVEHHMNHGYVSSTVAEYLIASALEMRTQLQN